LFCGTFKRGKNHVAVFVPDIQLGTGEDQRIERKEPVHGRTIKLNQVLFPI